MVQKPRYLYRGIQTDLYEKLKGKLVPKITETFTYTFTYGEEGLLYGSGAKYGSAPENAVLRHQYNQEGLPTSGISTTPHLHRAQFYATKGGEVMSGYIYKIDRELLEIYGVTEYVVARYVTIPSVPKDDEIILVAKDFDALPEEIVVEVILFSKEKDSKK